MKRHAPQTPAAGLAPRFKLWLSSGDTEGVFGDGKWRLLEAIGQDGSLRAAAKTLGISYRKAWGDLKKAEESLGVQFIDRHRGGQSGGEMTLTAAGTQWVKAYGRFRADVEKHVDRAFANFLEKT